MTLSPEQSEKRYRLLGADGNTYQSECPGQLGGYRPKKIYGRLDCWSANKHLASGGYVKHRVFFSDRAAAVAAEYRPCGHCMREDYQLWKQSRIEARSEFHKGTSP